MQTNFDFSQAQHHEDGKKLKRLPTAVSEDLKTFVEMMATKQRVSASELVHKYIVKGLKDDIGDVFFPEPHLDKTLRELLGKYK